jgi:hypothetical protein
MMAGRLSKIPPRRIRLGGAALGTILSLSLAACDEPPAEPEEALREWVQKGTEFAEQKDRRALVAMISPAYTDARGNDRGSIEDMLRFYFLRANRIALLTRMEDLRIHGNSAAELTLAVGMAGTDIGVLGFSADAYRFEMELEREGDDWLLIGARWAELGEQLR